MNYYKYVDNGIILFIGTGRFFTQITKEDYDELLEIIKNKPDDTESFIYLLHDDDKQYHRHKRTEPIDEEELNDD